MYQASRRHAKLHLLLRAEDEVKLLNQGVALELVNMWVEYRCWESEQKEIFSSVRPERRGEAIQQSSPQGRGKSRGAE